MGRSSGVLGQRVAAHHLGHGVADGRILAGISLNRRRDRCHAVFPIAGQPAQDMFRRIPAASRFAHSLRYQPLGGGGSVGPQPSGSFQGEVGLHRSSLYYQPRPVPVPASASDLAVMRRMGIEAA